MLAFVSVMSGAAPAPGGAQHSSVPASKSLPPSKSVPATKSAPAAKIRIGRIFFSPAERRHRSDKASSKADARSTRDSAGAERFFVNGAISSSSQGRAVWVNGVPIEDSAKLNSAWTDSSGRVWLRDDRHIPRRVQPGQAFDPASGAVDDLLPAGSVARR
jgi:hypothetical protein